MMDPNESIYEAYRNLLGKLRKKAYLGGYESFIANFEPENEEEHMLLLKLQNDHGAVKLKRLTQKNNFDSLIDSVKKGDFPILNIYSVEIIEIKFKSLEKEAFNKNSVIVENNIYQLEFNKDDGITQYKGRTYAFIGKGRALLSFLCLNKNTPFEVGHIKEKCNPMITTRNHHFRREKDIRDTINYIRKKLKVNKGEFFPIKKRDGNFIWIE